MGQIQSNNNIFRKSIVDGLKNCGIQFFVNCIPYPKKLNYGLIIKPLTLDPMFKEPIRHFFNGYPYHIGVIRNDRIYSFCPDLKNPHRGTLYNDIYNEHISDWEDYEIFWFTNVDDYLLIESRLLDLLSISKKKLSIDEFNNRYGTKLKLFYNLLTNNCTDIALSVLIGQSRCFQVEAISNIIYDLSELEQIKKMLPEYGMIWLNDFKTNIKGYLK